MKVALISAKTPNSIRIAVDPSASANPEEHGGDRADHRVADPPVGAANHQPARRVPGSQGPLPDRCEEADGLEPQPQRDEDQRRSGEDRQRRQRRSPAPSRHRCRRARPAGPGSPPATIPGNRTIARSCLAALIAAQSRSTSAPAPDQHLADHRRRKQAVVDDSGLPGKAGRQLGRIADLAKVVGDHAAVGARRRVASAHVAAAPRAGSGSRRARTRRAPAAPAAQAVSVGLLESAITTKRSAAAATIFSRVWAPPPPLTSQRSGDIWSAPSIAMSSRTKASNASTARPSSRPRSSVSTEVATQRSCRPRSPAPAGGRQRSSRCPGRRSSRPRPGPPPPRPRAASRPRCRYRPAM